MPATPSRRTGPRPSPGAVRAPRVQPPDLSDEDPTIPAERLADVPPDAFGRIARVRVVGGTELPALDGAELAHVRIESAFAAGWSASGLRAEECELQALRVGAAEMPDASWRSVRLRGGRWGYLNLRGAVLEDCVLEDAEIEDLDLGAARTDRVVVRGCRIGTLHLHEATCRDLDLRTSTIDRVEGLGGARGAVADRLLVEQWAPALAAHLGLRVVHPG